MPRFQVILTPEENERFEAYCESTGHKKSTLAARLIREHLDGKQFAYQPELIAAQPNPSPRRATRSRT